MAKKKANTKVSELVKLNQDLLDLRLKHASMALKETHKTLKKNHGLFKNGFEVFLEGHCFGQDAPKLPQALSYTPVRAALAHARASLS